jgi:membrane-associated phospholipid phosphatase
MNSSSIFLFLDYIGFSAPYLLLLVSIYLLSSKTYYLIYYIIGFGFNILLNLILKGIIQQPRPTEDLKLINIAKNNGKRISFDVYGMPSGHAQLCFYSTVFIYLVFKNTNITIFYIIISLITMYQRLKYKNHTLLQVIIGALVGGLFSYLVFELTKKNISGKWNKKNEDNALN